MPRLVPAVRRHASCRLVQFGRMIAKMFAGSGLGPRSISINVLAGSASVLRAVDDSRRFLRFESGAAHEPPDRLVVAASIKLRELICTFAIHYPQSVRL